MNAFLKSQFSFWPLVWTCHSRTNHSEINILRERQLRIIYSDKIYSVSILNRNLKLLAIEMYKAHKGLSPPIITEIFEKKNEHQYNLKHNSEFTRPAVNSVYHGTENVSFLGPKIRDILPVRLKKIDSLRSFKTAIKSWKPEKCLCTICRRYIHNVGFI